MNNKWLLIVVLIIAFSPLVFLKDAEFLGADSIAEEKIQNMDPSYVPWFEAIFEPASGEVESLLFALQATIGAGFIGYVVGLYKGRHEGSPK